MDSPRAHHSKVMAPLPQDRHIEVKGRSKATDTITVSRNDPYALNQADKFCWLSYW